MNDKKENKLLFLFKMLAVNLLFVAEFALAFWKPIVACAVFLLIIVNMVVFCILRPFSDGSEYSGRIISKVELNRASKLLRYATAVLSFISFLTTAEGMKSYVFEHDWQAYLGSFAVQSILVVFSLLLCHIYSTIGKIAGIGEVGKRMLLGALTLFFSISLLVSSVFSYSYIAGNAYKNSWAGDAETMIQEFLIRETGDLKEENERIGRLLLDEIIRMVSDDFGTLIEECVKQQKENAEAEIETFQLEKLYFDEEKFNIDSYFIALYNQNSAHPGDVENVKLFYLDLIEQIEECLNTYNDISESLSTELPRNDLDSSKKYIEEVSMKLNSLLGSIKAIKETSDSGGTFYLQKDLTSLKGKMQLVISGISDFIDGEKSKVDNCLLTLTSAENGVATAAGEPILSRLEDIQQDIYLLKASQTVTVDSGEVQNSTKEVVEKIVSLLKDIPMDGTLSSADIAPLAILTDMLNEYDK